MAGDSRHRPAIEQYQRDIGPMAEGPLLEDVICLGPDGQGFDTPT